MPGLRGSSSRAAQSSARRVFGREAKRRERRCGTSRICLGTAKLLLERRKALFGAAAVAVSLTLAGTQSLASSVPAPVSVTRCRVDTSYVASNPFYGPAQQSAGGNVRLAFENDDDVAAIGVRFIVTEGAHKQHMYISGRFARGVEIERTFEEDSAASGNQNAKCAVADVYYADGSSWTSDFGAR